MRIFMFIHSKNIFLLNKMIKTQFVYGSLNRKTPRKNNFVWIITPDLNDVLTDLILPFLWKSILLAKQIIFPTYNLYSESPYCFL